MVALIAEGVLLMMRAYCLVGISPIALSPKFCKEHKIVVNLIPYVDSMERQRVGIAFEASTLLNTL